MISITELPPPSRDESWYRYCFTAGLRGVPWEEILAWANSCDKALRPKDLDNYNRGARKNSDPFAVPTENTMVRVEETKLDSFPKRPTGYRPPIDWAIPCSSDCKPLVRWGTQRHTEAEAWAYRGCEILGKNLRGLQMVVIDVDGDHNGIDVDLIEYWRRFINYTSARVKYVQGHPVSFHLEFWTDRVIPSMHFRNLDVLGNRNNQVQYLKPSKIHNGLPLAPFDEYVWEELQTYVRNVNGGLDQLHAQRRVC